MLCIFYSQKQRVGGNYIHQPMAVMKQDKKGIGRLEATELMQVGLGRVVRGGVRTRNQVF